jgi:hypothetical protein
MHPLCMLLRLNEADYCTTTKVQRQTDEFYEMYPIHLSVGAMRTDGRQTDELVSREFNEVNDRQMKLMKNVFHSPVRRQHLAVLSRLFNGGSGLSRLCEDCGWGHSIISGYWIHLIIKLVDK